MPGLIQYSMQGTVQGKRAIGTQTAVLYIGVHLPSHHRLHLCHCPPCNMLLPDVAHCFSLSQTESRFFWYYTVTLEYTKNKMPTA